MSVEMRGDQGASVGIRALVTYQPPRVADGEFLLFWLFCCFVVLFSGTDLSFPWAVFGPRVNQFQEFLAFRLSHKGQGAVSPWVLCLVPWAHGPLASG